MLSHYTPLHKGEQNFQVTIPNIKYAHSFVPHRAVLRDISHITINFRLPNLDKYSQLLDLIDFVNLITNSSIYPVQTRQTTHWLTGWLGMLLQKLRNSPEISCVLIFFSFLISLQHRTQHNNGFTTLRDATGWFTVLCLKKQCILMIISKRYYIATITLPHIPQGEFISIVDVYRIRVV